MTFILGLLRARHACLRMALARLLLTGLLAGPGVTAATVLQDFDTPGTAFDTAISLDAFASGARSAPTVVSGGPTGSFMRLIHFQSTFGRYRTGLGFDQTEAGAIARVRATFDFRITCAGARSGFSGGGCADGFSINFLDTAISGTSGAFPFDENGIGQTFETAPDPEITTTGAFSVGFRTFSTAAPGGNSLLATFDNATIAGVGSAGIPFAELDLATGLNSSFGAFHHAEVELVLDPVPTLTVDLVDGTDNSTFRAYDAIDLSGATGLSPSSMRVNFGARVGDAGMTVDLDNIEVTFEPVQATTTTVPEPGSLGLLAAAALVLAGAGAVRGRRGSRDAGQPTPVMAGHRASRLPCEGAVAA